MTEENIVDVAAIGERFEEKGYFRRLKDMFAGLGAPHGSAAYKLARLELQRQAAPLIAFVSVFLFVVVLIAVTALQGVEKKSYDIVIQEPDQEQPPPEPEEEPVETPPDPEPTPIDDLQPPVDRPADPSPVSDLSTPTPTPPQKNVTVKPAEANTVAQVKSPVTMKVMIASRDPGSIGRHTSGGTECGDANTEAAVLKVLWWLKATQKIDPNNPDVGYWDGGVRLANTALAVLTYLAHGEYPGSLSLYRNDFGPVVERAINHLVASITPGSKVTMKGTDGNEYAFLIATYALSEAYGMTRNPNLKDPTLMCLDRIIKGQSPTGGWDYKINPASTRDDLSFAGWALQALKAGKMAGLHPEGLDACIKKAIKCLKTRSWKKDHFVYVASGNQHPGLTATGCLAMQLLGYGKEPEVKASLDYMREWQPAFAGGEVTKQFGDKSSQYYCYYATQCKYQAGMKQGAEQKDLDAWLKWNKAMKVAYTQPVPEGTPGLHDLPAKVKDHQGGEHRQGYYTNLDQHTSRPVMDSCLAALQLMVYYRYLPTTQTKAGADASDETSSATVDRNEVQVDVDL